MLTESKKFSQSKLLLELKQMKLRIRTASPVLETWGIHHAEHFLGVTTHSFVKTHLNRLALLNRHIIVWIGFIS